MPSQLTSIIIVNYNTRELTDRLLKSLYQYCGSNLFEIILVDNNSRDDSVWYLKAHYPDLKYIINRVNYGFGKAVNQGARMALGEYLWLLNSDCELIKPILPELIDVLNQSDDAAIVTPKTIDQNDQFHANCRKFPNYYNLLFSRGSLLSRLPFLNKQAAEYTLPDYDTVTRVDSVAGTAILIRRAEFENMGGFDERFFMYLEDTDLCLRLNKQKKYCYYVPQAVVRHKFQGSAEDSHTPRIVHHHRSMLEYFLKWKSANIPGNILLFIMLTLNMCIQIILSYVKLRRNTNS